MNLKEQIDFEVFKVLLEVRTSFRLEELKAIKPGPEEPELWAQNRRLEYVQGHLKRLGRGGSRAVYLLSNRYVLKVADPGNYKLGKEQNRIEVEVYTNPKIAPIVTKVYDSDPQYNWIISELVRPLSDGDEFSKLTGISFEKFSNTLNGLAATQVGSVDEAKKNALFYIERYERQLKDINSIDPAQQESTKSEAEMMIKLYKETLQVLQQPMVEATLGLMVQGGLAVSDLRRVEHWGKTADGRVVVLDYGYSQ